MSGEERQAIHDRRAAALRERASARETRVLTEDEVRDLLRRARESNRGVEGVETADGDAVMWW